MVKRQCRKCKAIFARKSHYDYHINRKYDCTPDAIYLDDTNDETNTNLEKFQNIPFCSEIVPNYSKTIQTNPNEKFKENNLNTTEANTNNLSCGFCSKNYSTKTNLNKHLKICKLKKENDNEKENVFKLLLEKDKENKENKARIEKLEKQNHLLMEKIDNLIPKTNEITKIHKTIKKLETTIPANTNLAISNQYLEKILEKDKEIEQIINQKDKEKKKNLLLLKIM